MISLIIFCLLTACLSVFLDFCMEKGNIFRGYYNWLTYWLWLPKKRIDCEGWDFYFPFGETKNATATPYGINKVYFIKNKYQFLYKPLGGCVYCFGTWVFIVLFLCVSVFSNYYCGKTITLIGLFLGCGINYVWIKILNKI